MASLSHENPAGEWKAYNDYLSYQQTDGQDIAGVPYRDIPIDAGLVIVFVRARRTARAYKVKFVGGEAVAACRNTDKKGKEQWMNDQGLPNPSGEASVGWFRKLSGNTGETSKAVVNLFKGQMLKFREQIDEARKPPQH